MYRIKRFSYIHLSEKSFDDSENKDSGFNWGKALGTAAAIGGTMYGAKKGVFGNTVRRGYNTAYGKIGKAIGSKGMMQSAARDYALGADPKKSFKDNYRSFFKDKLGDDSYYKAATSGIKPKKTMDQIRQEQQTAAKSTTAAASTTTTTAAPQPITEQHITTPTVNSVLQKPTNFEAKKKEIKDRLNNGFYKNTEPTTIKEINQATEQRNQLAQRSNYQQSKKRAKITYEQQQQRKREQQSKLGKNQFDSKNQNSRGHSIKKSPVPVAATAQDYYNNPYNEYRMQMFSCTKMLKNQRFF